jgi:hypothetical protein
VITCHRKHLIARCNERGYVLEQVMPCVVSQDGPFWTIDETHESYPRERELQTCLAGTMLKSLLSRIGLEASPDCSCNAKAAHMDMMGCQWARDNLDTVVDWLEEEAKKRGLPFVRMAGRGLVTLAIRLAERKVQSTVSV